MTIVYQTERAALHQGDCLVVLKALADCSVDAVVTDPPYHLTQVSRRGSARQNDPETPFGRTRVGGERGFMGKTWDGGDIAHRVELWDEVMRVLKPGGHLIAFGGTRTFHRLAVAIEDAGFELRDTICNLHERDCPWLLGWVFGSGFPKSLDVSKAIDKAAGAQREVVGKRKSYRPNSGAVREYENFQDRSSGELTAPATDAAAQWKGWGTALKPAIEPIVLARKPLVGTVAENVLEHGTGALNIDGCRIETAEVGTPREKDPERMKHPDWRMTGGSTGGGATTPLGRWPANVTHDGSEEVLAGFPRSKSNGGLNPIETGATIGTFDEKAHRPFFNFGDDGSAARFFYCAKASRSDRNEGLDDPGPQFEHGTTLRKVENTATRGNTHPTVKPVSLMKWLCRLITPPGGTICDPFTGSGSTGKAALLEGFRFLGIERDPEYIEIAKARLKHAEETADAERQKPKQKDLIA